MRGGSDVVRLERRGPKITIGSHPDNDVVLDDHTVSCFHCVLEQSRDGIVLRDLESLNGTFLRGLRVREALLGASEDIAVGRTQLGLRIIEGGASPVEEVRGFGPVLGTSPVMRRLFRLMRQVAPTDATVLLDGETGVGKGLVARALHAASQRAGGPFTVVDCAALPPTLIESELFGHEKGAFTGAERARAGAFEAADGGTLFLDEIGELPLDLQAKFLRAIEDRQVKRIGATAQTPFEIRLIVATNRDLAAEVDAGRFRSDLFYRLNVVRLRVPPLRERREDIRLIAQSLLASSSCGPPPFEITEEDWRAMERAPWPGNVRELRTAVERAVVLGDRSYLVGDRAAQNVLAEPHSDLAIDRMLPFREAKRQVVEAFEREFVRRIVAVARGNVSEAARLARMDRNYLRVLISRHLESSQLDRRPVTTPPFAVRSPAGDGRR